MAKPPPTTGTDLSHPHKSLLKRIDIGLVTGITAVFISFLAMLTSRATLKMNQDTQKARVLPIVEIDRGYVRADDGKYDFAITLTNSGAGIAHIQRAKVTANGEDITDYQAFEDAVMNRRMRGWARLTERPATGYLRAGESVAPVHFAMNAASREVSTYLRGEYGTPYSDMDIEVCYCSVFDDCWVTRYSDRAQPEQVSACSADGTLDDDFTVYIEQRAAARLKTE